MLLAILAILLGGVMKGAIGAGVPVIAAPALTMLFNVQTAVAILVVPNLLSNVWQAWHFRNEAMPRRFLILFAGGGMLGVAVGTFLLAVLPQETLSLMVACAVLAYITLRLARPGWTLARDTANRLCGAAGIAGGFLQGATGISAPASITFLNAMKLPREAFIGTISIFFVSMTAMQIPALWSVGLLSLEMLAYGFGALGLVFLSMPLGNWLGKRASSKVFDMVMLVTLGAIALKILFEAIF
ncbi:sulfite exporter TauE/SafE family protein [Roseinatronobacter bogoriensis subsp. barguzinensis]|uniref:Probable membrane transporter protein n=1 Tax=Roseinatronobacter bogoriensis subsp. barguzinensis TaxID=441209 RepID=A0A2K8KFI2_9RHOB|nr:sulfite exporter TauE/SafE family protein [Rhodobaca barguzinensis]